MAIYRKVHTTFWSDSFVLDLPADKKLFYLYLLTNERTKQCGIYEITARQISFDLNFTIEKVNKMIDFFTRCGRIRYNADTKELALRNWMKYNSSDSPKVRSCIEKEFKTVKDRVLIQYVNNMLTVQMEDERQESKKQENKKKQEPEFDQTVISLYDECIKEFPDTLHPKTDTKKRSWMSALEKLMRIDKVPSELILEIVKRARRDQFWSRQFLSLTKLRQSNTQGVKYVVVFYEQFIRHGENQKGNDGNGVSHEQLAGILKKHFDSKGDTF